MSVGHSCLVCRRTTAGALCQRCVTQARVILALLEATDEGRVHGGCMNLFHRCDEPTWCHREATWRVSCGSDIHAWACDEHLPTVLRYLYTKLGHSLQVAEHKTDE